MFDGRNAVSIPYEDSCICCNPIRRSSSANKEANWFCVSVLGMVSELSHDCVLIRVYRKNRSNNFSLVVLYYYVIICKTMIAGKYCIKIFFDNKDKNENVCR